MRRLFMMVSALLVCTPAAQAQRVEASWTLVGISVDRRALVVTAPSHNGAGSVAVTPSGDLSVGVTGAVYERSNPMPLNNPRPTTLVVPLPIRLAGQQVVGDRRETKIFPANDWNTWRHTWRGAVGRESPGPGSRKAPSTVGLNVVDAIEIANAIGVSRNRIRIVGPRDGYVVKQKPSRTGWLQFKTGRLTFTTSAIGG